MHISYYDRSRGTNPLRIKSDYKLGICCLSAKHITLRNKTGWLGLVCPSEATYLPTDCFVSVSYHYYNPTECLCQINMLVKETIEDEKGGIRSRKSKDRKYTMVKRNL